MLVCGERERGDDAAALLAVDGLTDLPGWIQMRAVGQLDPADLLDIPADDAWLLIDAVVGVSPGAVVHGPLASLLAAAADSADSAAAQATLRSSHALSPTDVLRLAQTLRGDLPPGSYVGIGGASFGLGAGVSAPVAGALPAFREAIMREACRLSRS